MDLHFYFRILRFYKNAIQVVIPHKLKAGMVSTAKREAPDTESVPRSPSRNRSPSDAFCKIGFS